MRRLFIICLLAFVSTNVMSQPFFNKGFVNTVTPAHTVYYVNSLNGFWVNSTFSGDLNEDGFADIIYAGQTPILENVINIQFGDTCGIFDETPDTITISYLAEKLQLEGGDINNDGHLDFILLQNDTVACYLGDGAGNFSAPVFTSMVFPGLVTFYSTMSVGDFNNDNYPDLFINSAHDQFPFDRSYILYGTSNGQFTVTPFTLFSTVDLSATADVNNDGWMDVLYFPENSPGLVYLVNTNGILDSSGQSIFNASIGNIQPRALKIIQADTDSLMEFFVQFDTTLLYGELNPVSIQQAKMLNFSSGYRHFETGDFDGNGLTDDLVISFVNAVPKFYKLNGTTFTVVSTALSEELPGKMQSGDFDNDGDDDIYYTGEQKTNINLGGLRFSKTNSILFNGNVVDVQSADFDLDGYDDVAAISFPVGNALSIGYGGACGIRQVINHGTSNVEFIRIGYFNNDNLPDLAFCNSISYAITVLINQGNRTFAPAQQYTPWHPNNEIAVGDFNEDGYDDLFILGYLPFGDRYSIMFADPSGSGMLDSATAELNPATVNVDCKNPVVTDFNMDGHADIILSHSVALGQRMTIMFGDGAGNFTSIAYPNGTGSSYTAPIDLNGDSLPDLITSSVSQFNNTDFYCNDGGTPTTISYGCVTSLTESVTGITVGDLNNDAINDFIIDRVNVGNYSKPFILKPNYTPVRLNYSMDNTTSRSAFADLNGDGKQDLVFPYNSSIIPVKNLLPTPPTISALNDSLFMTPGQLAGPSPDFATPLAVEWFRDTAMVATNQNFLPVTTNGIYHVGLLYPDNVYVSAKYVVNWFPVGISEQSKGTMQLYPNPADDVLNILLPEGLDNSGELSITDITGKVITAVMLNSGASSARIVVKDLSPGIYIARLYSSGFFTSKKFIIE